MDGLERETLTGQQSQVGPHSFVVKPTRLSHKRAKKDSFWIGRGGVIIVKSSRPFSTRRPTLQGKDFARTLLHLCKDIHLTPICL